MYLYSLSKKRFDPNTGEPLSPVMGRDKKRVICDYTGEEIDVWDNHEELPLYTTAFEYDDGAEPLWYEDQHPIEAELGLKFDYSSFSEFMESPYHFKNTETYGCSDVSMDLIEEWRGKMGKKSKGEENPWFNCNTIEQVFRVVRLRTLRKLLVEKKYTPEQLGLELA